MSTIMDLQVVDNKIVLYEITIEVRNLVLKMLFNDSPTLGRICECVGMVFADNQEVHHGMVELLLSIGDDSDRSATTFQVGDEIKFMEESQQIGFVGLETRTLFEA